MSEMDGPLDAYKNGNFDSAAETLEKSGQGAHRALAVAFGYGQIDGEHHKSWVIDQMVRLLTGNAYGEWIRLYEEGGEYEWEIGIAP